MGRFLVVLAAAALAGCQASPLASRDAGVTLRVRPVVQTSASYRLQDVLAPYTIDNVDHVTLRVVTVENGLEIPVSDGQGGTLQLDRPATRLNTVFSFGDLKANTTYRVWAAAYKADDLDPADLISTTALSDDPSQRSYVDIPVTNDPHPEIQTLQVRLIDTPFAGHGKAIGIQVLPGNLVPAPNESME